MGNLHPGQDPTAPVPTAVDSTRVASDAVDSDEPGPFVMACETLAGDAVVNAADEELGKLEHLMVDVPSGTIAYAVLACGGVFGIGAKLFAIPWRALTLDAERNRFVLDMARERLEAAPCFDRDHWPSMTDPGWARGVHAYYGVRPYWSARTIQ